MCIFGWSCCMFYIQIEILDFFIAVFIVIQHAATKEKNKICNFAQLKMEKAQQYVYEHTYKMYVKYIIIVLDIIN